MNRAGMPEATVDENCDPCPRKSDIGRAGHPAEIDAEPQSPPMKFRPYGSLNRGPRTRHLPHLIPYMNIEWRRPVPRLRGRDRFSHASILPDTHLHLWVPGSTSRWWCLAQYAAVQRLRCLLARPHTSRSFAGLAVTFTIGSALLSPTTRSAVEKVSACTSPAGRHSSSAAAATECRFESKTWGNTLEVS